MAAELAAAMQAESRALVERAVFDDSFSYRELFTATETFVETDELAAHYELAGTTPGWLAYGDSKRGGIFGHGCFLSGHGNPDDTSPTKRGEFVREFLMCQPVPPPPPDVNDDPPPPTNDTPCKVENLIDVHLTDATCAACHTQMDPIGFGLEQFDRTGRFRESELDDPLTEDVDEAAACPIDGEGEVTGLGTFNGPGELGELLTTSEQLDGCIVTQVSRFAHGRMPGATQVERDAIEGLTVTFIDSGHDFGGLLTALVSREEFAYRRHEEERE